MTAGNVSRVPFIENGTRETFAMMIKRPKLGGPVASMFLLVLG